MERRQNEHQHKQQNQNKQRLSVVVMAAGGGTRMKSATPKVLHKVCGRAMISHILEQALVLSDDIHVVLYHEKEMVSSAIKAEFGDIVADLACGSFGAESNADSKKPSANSGAESNADSNSTSKNLNANSNSDSKNSNAESVTDSNYKTADSKSDSNNKTAISSADSNNKTADSNLDSKNLGADSQISTAKIFLHTQDHKNAPGTGGAVKCVLESRRIKHATTLILNGDMPLVTAKSLGKIAATIAQNSSQELSAVSKNADSGADSKTTESSADLTLSIIRPSDPTGYGRVAMDEGGNIIKIIEQKDAVGDELKISTANAGVYAARTDFLSDFIPRLTNANAQGEFYLTDLVALGVSSGAKIIGVEVAEREFMGVNTKAHLAAAEELMLEKIRQNAMESGVIMHLPQTIYIDARARFVGECELEANVAIKGACVVDSSHIKSGSVVESSRITRSDIGPNAHIRPNCVITDTHIGNFVEAKAAILEGAKAGHLSYLGDCEVGRGSNIGAGVITCNYDGARKHKTIIGARVFVGSDTQLVAPVKVGAGAFIGAGSTITKDVGAGALALSRAPQKEIPNYKKGGKND